MQFGPTFAGPCTPGSLQPHRVQVITESSLSHHRVKVITESSLSHHHVQVITESLLSHHRVQVITESSLSHQCPAQCPSPSRQHPTRSENRPLAHCPPPWAHVRDSFAGAPAVDPVGRRTPAPPDVFPPARRSGSAAALAAAMAAATVAAVAGSRVEPRRLPTGQHARRSVLTEPAQSCAARHRIAVQGPAGILRRSGSVQHALGPRLSSHRACPRRVRHGPVHWPGRLRLPAPCG